MAKKQSDIIKFSANEPITIVLDTEPSTAKSITRESKWGVKTSYTIFCDQNRVLFASEALFLRLSSYHKGDTIKITLIDGKTWLITSAGTTNAGAATDQANSAGSNAESMTLLRKVASDVDLIKAHLLGTKTNDKTEATEEEEDNDEELFG